MKQFILFSSMFVFSLLVSCGESKQDNNESKQVNNESKQDNNESNSSIKVQDIGLEVMSKDLGRMNWEEAKKACADLGDGWRLPTMDELKKMYEFKDKIGGFEYDFYKSSTENDDGVWSFFFGQGYASSGPKSATSFVRAVRDLK